MAGSLITGVCSGSATVCWGTSALKTIQKRKALKGILHEVTLPAYLTWSLKSIKAHCLRSLTSRSLASESARAAAFYLPISSDSVTDRKTIVHTTFTFLPVLHMTSWFYNSLITILDLQLLSKSLSNLHLSTQVICRKLQIKYFKLKTNKKHK